MAFFFLFFFCLQQVGGGGFETQFSFTVELGNATELLANHMAILKVLIVV